ncbi:restriction endonuclease [Sedimentitalea sp. JM2-8]|uniref:Restriction endonuclease n=1 Tax=Sedimentitalea xiamensis TaxID=3050037 RepID=A0ABT7FK74_9RHOB|nr:restriction endonuclease [Sedimentitalea xiamensis]MDK3075535.1 restriction endonuclease [Sedimentitalea xiamensis]
MGILPDIHIWYMSLAGAVWLDGKAEKMGLSLGLGLGLGSHGAPARPKNDLDELSHELLLPAELLNIVDEANEGAIVTALSYPWATIFAQLKKDPELLFQFSKSPHVFEEFVAASWDKAGFKVTLTPRSGDGGKDVIAEKSGFGAIRILDQCKAFSRGHRVGPNDVRAMMGTMALNTNASKAVISTTSVFSPTIRNEWESFIPYRLELREGPDIVDWLSTLESK